MTTIEQGAKVGLRTETLIYGTAAGLAGGVVFGVLMQMMDMMSMVAMLVGGSSSGLGWVVHLAISALIGTSFAALFGRWAMNLVTSIGLGAAYGMLWWVVGALILMPTKLGMDLMVINDTALQSLMGHLMFGMVLGGVYAILARRSAH